jgi:hypothetical protein
MIRDAGVKGVSRVTQIRAAALTKLFQYGATREEADRWSRHSGSSSTVMYFYDKSGNDNAREKLAGSLNSVVSNGRGKEPR